MGNNNKLDINQLLSMLDSNDLMENINRLAFMMGNPEKGESIKNMIGGLLSQKSQEIESVSSSMKHVDPAINLLLAIKPYLSENRQRILDDSMKTLNMSFFIRELKRMT
ncbi:hypothetical protein [Desulfitibacter alkalitolerans]|uniref:hypothetical protein n=1 Tax=Desulfitibacter alkalitolerans TaxID=264641 RepID=UPI00048210E7|nr:hypothetical protein [Desulfitibacter alkalitolerans]